MRGSIGETSLNSHRTIDELPEALPFSVRLAIWKDAIGAVRDACAPGSYHPRLTSRSFLIEPDADSASGHRVRMTDAHRVRPLANHAVEGDTAVWRCAAPEQTGLIDAVPDERTNVYNLGVIGACIFRAELPWQRREGASRARAILVEASPRVSVSGAPTRAVNRLNDVLAVAMAKEAHARHEDLGRLELEVALLLSMVTESGPAKLGIVGRRAATHDLESAIAAARAGEGVSIVVSGESGTGKSYLWKSVEARCASPQDLWITVKCPQRGSRPYAAIGAILERLAEVAVANRSTGDGRTRRDIVRDVATDAGVTESGLTLASMLVPSLKGSGKLELRPDDVSRDAYEASSARDLARLIEALGRGGGVTIVAIDDYQWSDRYTRNVMQELVRARSRGFVPVAIVRPGEAARVPLGAFTLRVDLEGLNPTESDELLSAALPRPGLLSIDDRAAVVRLSGGNPLALINLALMLSDDSARIGPLLTPPHRSSGRLLASLVEARLDALAPTTAQLVELLSLLLQPVPHGVAVAAASGIGTSLAPVLDEATQAGVLVVREDDGSVSFVHDTVESAARERALRRQTARRLAADLLLGQSERGSAEASYALAQLLAPADVSPQAEARTAAETSESLVIEELSVVARGSVLVNAAAYALRVGLASDALRFATAAIATSPDVRGRAHLIAHESAYLLDDPALMSHHFRGVYHFGDLEERAQAREVWVRHCYAHAAFEGAVRVGSIALAELGFTEGEGGWRSLSPASARLIRRRPARLRRQLVDRGPAHDRAARYALRICYRLMLPVLTIERSALASLAALALRLSLRHGWTEHTPIAFLCLLLARAESRDPGRDLGPFGRAAVGLAREIGNEFMLHEVETYVEIMAGPWTKPYRDYGERLRVLAERSVRLGSRETAVHAWHLHAQTLFYHGAELVRVGELFHRRRRDIASYGFARSERALQKFEQSVASLMGRTADPLKIDGEICREDEYLDRLEHARDNVSLFAYRMLKGLLALFADRPKIAYEWLLVCERDLGAIGSLHEVALIPFYLGFVAFRVGDRACGARALARLRRLTREVPATHRHRLAALRAERAMADRRPRRAATLYRRAVRQALAEDVTHEAALFSERLADAYLRLGRSVDASEALYRAESLYRRWGARPAAARVRVRLGWPEASEPASVTGRDRLLASVRRRAPTADLVTEGLRLLRDLTATRECYLEVQRDEATQWFSFGVADGSIATPDDEGALRAQSIAGESVPIDLALELESVSSGVSALEIERAPDGERAGLVCGSVSTSERCTVRLLLVGTPDVSRLSSSVLERVEDVATIIASG
ncbi:MAG: AAA family ATPase, partial [Spirochaetota bacterium]